ncbi:DUF4334 domain-containing protein [Nocardioides marmoriginsengisoli]|uniref:DUF4334 domain-containing protein n=1 Tax=Nocardioides marmoriginsengisoli TaxID=661483 RepID=UPI001C8292A4|nr:DUF4334 domain-containing protein [Nocardioides marmoriginsengisoli]
MSDDDVLRSRFELLRDAESADPADLDALWADLATLRPEEMLGAWRGGDFPTGHPASGLLARIDWHGKRFDALLDGHPLICRDEDGALYSNTKYAGGGYSSLWEVGFRGETTATMVYDAMAVFDHFKRVDDTTVMGIMNGKLEAAFGTADLYYFWLERDQG